MVWNVNAASDGLKDFVSRQQAEIGKLSAQIAAIATRLAELEGK